MPAVMEDVLVLSTVSRVLKNARSVFCNPENIAGVRNLIVIIRSPNPITRIIFIRLF